MCLVQRLSEFEVRGRNGGGVGPAERRGVDSKKLPGRVIKSSREAQLAGSLPNERPACRHAQMLNDRLPRWSTRRLG